MSPSLCVAMAASRVASGVYWYLKHSCNASISWGEEGSGDHVKPFSIAAGAALRPVLDAPVRIQ
jgi:hypothetical protein